VCGRFTLTIPSYEVLAEALGVDPVPHGAEYRPRFNVAPSDTAWIFRIKGDKRELVPASWGLVPWWAKTATDGGRPINARAETLLDKRMFRDAFVRKRCVVLSDGFFEWKRPPVGPKQPIWFRPKAGGLMLLGGVYDTFRDPETGHAQRTFSIVTTKPNGDVADVHDRMPLVISPQDLERWVAEMPKGANDVTDDVRALLRAPPDGSLERFPVSRRVNDVRNDDPGCVAPPDEDADAEARAPKKEPKPAREPPGEPAPKPAKEKVAKTTAQLGLFDVGDVHAAAGGKRGRRG
jgi:putative SOS response-associated peptidase YedK